MNSIEARLIDPQTKTISMILIGLDSNNEPDIEEVQEILKCSQIEAVRLSGNRTLLFDEEALLLNKNQKFFQFSDPATRVELISGKALLIQNDSNWYPIDFDRKSTFKITWPSEEDVKRIFENQDQAIKEIVSEINTSSDFKTLQKQMYDSLKKEFLNEVKNPKETLNRMLDWFADFDIAEVITFMNDTLDFHNK